MNRYNATDKWVWETLFSRQAEQLKHYACKAYLECLDKMSPVLNKDAIPDFEK